MSEFKTPADVVRFIEEEKVEIVDLRFMDFPGLWQHFSVPITELTLESFKDGYGFDGSSIRGWRAINESDMLVVPSSSASVQSQEHFCASDSIRLKHWGQVIVPCL